MNFKDYITEILKNPYSTEREYPPQHYILDQWGFGIGDEHNYAVRFQADPQSSSRVSRVVFGVKRNKRISTKITSIKDINSYLATVISSISNALEDPTPKVKRRRDGIILTIPVKLYDKYGSRFKRIVKRKARDMGYRLVADLEDVDDVYKGIYLYRMGKNPTKLFPQFQIELESEEDSVGEVPTPKETKAPVRAAVVPDSIPEPEDANKPDADVDAVVAGKPPVENAVIEFTPKEKYELASENGQSLRKIEYTEKEKNTAFSKAVFEDLMTGSFYDDKSMIDDIKVYKRMTTKEMEIVLANNSEFKNFPYHEGKVLLALNMKGVQTSDIYDLFGRFNNKVRDTEIKREDFIERYNIVKSDKITVDEVLECVLESNDIYEKVCRDFGVERLFKEYGPPRHSDSIVVESYTKSDPVRAANNILASMTEEEYNTPEDQYLKFTQRKNKVVRDINFDLFKDESYISVLDYSLAEIREKGDLLEYLEIYDKTPDWFQARQGLYSADYDHFTLSFFGHWVMTGGSNAHNLAHVACADIGVNQDKDEYYSPRRVQPYGRQDNVFDEYAKSERVKNHFDKMYEKSQEFFKKKYKKKYDTTVIKLYRGLGIEDVSGYAPSTMESWSPLVSTAKRFASMMSRSHRDYTVLYAEVPIQYIIGTYESLGDVFEDDEMLKGKKEHIVMGGAFEHIPIYKYDVNRKELKPFKEHVIFEQKNERVPIVSPSKVNNKVGTGWMDNEDVTKGGWSDDVQVAIKAAWPLGGSAEKDQIKTLRYLENLGFIEVSGTDPLDGSYDYILTYQGRELYKELPK